MPGFYVENFGCRAAQADGAGLERQFEELGLSRASTPATASVVVLNTCTVTSAADQDARAAIRRVKRQNPEASIVVTGCYAQRAPEEIAALPGVSCVVGNSHKHQLAEIALGREAGFSQPSVFVPVEALGSGFARPKNDPQGLKPTSFAVLSDALRCASLAQGSLETEAVPFPKPRYESASPGQHTSEGQASIFVSDIFAHTELMAAPVFDAANERTRPNLKIQDGCDNRCSFCVIPYVRGQSRSLDVCRVLAEVNALVEAGYREVVLSGINLGRWGTDLGPQTSDFSDPRRLAGLVRVILEETSIEKLRISSVEPMDWTEELIGLVASSARIAKHAHVPLQSGSDAVLRRMHRKYRPWHYREKIEKIRAAMPEAAIGADVMVGFPGETDAEFETTRRLVEELPFTYLHVFTYSARPGTPAAGMGRQVPGLVARERNRVLRELAAGKKLVFMRGFVGKQIEAIALRTGGADFTEALTDNYLKLRLIGQHEANRWVRARVDGVEGGALVGAVLGGKAA